MDVCIIGLHGRTDVDDRQHAVTVVELCNAIAMFGQKTMSILGVSEVRPVVSGDFWKTGGW